MSKVLDCQKSVQNSLKEDQNIGYTSDTCSTFEHKTTSVIILVPTMASMRFESSTVANLMSLVDEHKDEFKEGEYIQLCNAMKFLHNQTLHQQPAPSIPEPPQQTDIVTNAMRLPSFIHHLESLVIELRAPGRVRNIDKENVLYRLFITHSLDRAVLSLWNEGTSGRVRIMQSRVSGIVPINALKRAYQDERDQRVENLRVQIRAKILVLEAQIERLRALPPNDPYIHRLVLGL